MKRLKKERQKRDMSQADLAFKLRIYPTQLSKIENGRIIPFKPNKEKLEKFFNMSIDDLLQEVE